MKNRLKNTPVNLETWFHNTMESVIKYGGPGSEYEIEGFMTDDDFCYMFCYQDRIKAIDMVDYIESAMNYGQDIKHKKNKVYVFDYGPAKFYFQAKNITKLKKEINTAINKWKEACEPIEDEPIKLAPSKRAFNLLKQMRASHMADSKGQSVIEASWICEMDEILKGMEGE